jgi:hypothetical protein
MLGAKRVEGFRSLQAIDFGKFQGGMKRLRRKEEMSDRWTLNRRCRTADTRDA